MNKNLKKVISAVGALSMVASSVAAFAADFPDVEETASYAQAVKELSALDIISGYEDGTFKPDELVTRAQISKMIVDALNERAQAESSKTATKFADVATGENGHWATGYINQGVADGFISGYSDTEFGPDDNVTYAQAQSMLVRAVGYDTYAKAQGGWPAGYKLYAGSLGITNGVVGVSSDDQQLTRAQVAQMLDNAMDVPVCVIKSWKTEWNGTQTPELEVKDGDDKDYQTLFTRNHKTYRVYGRITATSKSAGLDIDRVEFDVEKADNFDDETIKSDSPLAGQQMYFSKDINVDSALNVYSQALIQKDDDDDYTIISLVPATSNSSVSLASEDFDKTSRSGDKQYYQFYPAGTTRNSVKYQIADDAVFYVNGVEDGNLDFDSAAAMIDADNAVAVTLVKKSDTGKTTSATKGYNIVMITKYATAVVDDVNEKTSEVKITFDETSYTRENGDLGNAKSWTIDLDDDNIDYKFMLNGEGIAPTDIQVDDVLNIAYDRSGDFKDSNFYTVIVSRDTVTGRCSSVKANDDQFQVEYTVDGTKYKYATAGLTELTAGDSYVLYLDHFGRIAAVDDEESSKNLAVLKNVYAKSNGIDHVATIITKDGQEVEYTIDTNSVADFQQAKADGANTAVGYAVVDYKLTSAGKIKFNGVETATRGGRQQEYRASSTKFDDVRLVEVSTILDIEDMDDVKVVSTSSLTDGVKYDVYGYNVKDGNSRFVLITSGASSFTKDTQLAIFMGREVVEDDDAQYNLVVNGEEVSYILKDTITDIAKNGVIDEGDPVLVATDASGKISKITPVLNVANMISNGDKATFVENTVAGLVDKVVKDTLFVNEDLLDVDEDVTYAFGVALKKDGSDLTIGSVYTGDNGEYLTTLSSSNSLGDKKAFVGSITSDTKIYAYDYDITNKNLSKVVLDNGVEVTSIANSDYTVKGGDEINLTSAIADNEVVFALARVENNDIAELYLILPADL